MATLVRPVLFSGHIGVPPAKLAAKGLLDPILNADTKLFIDPLLLRTSTNSKIRAAAYDQLRDRFGEVLRLLIASKTKGDPAWKAAAQLLDLRERSETGLGYGGSGVRGSSRPAQLRDQVLTTAKLITELGEDDPEIISLMAVFEDGVGPDTISDLTTNMILPVIAEITEEFCLDQGLSTTQFPTYGNRRLVANPFNNGKPVLLVPVDILRDLPLAADWSDVSRVVFENEEIRRQVNKLLGGIAQTTVRERKAALRKVLLRSLGTLHEVLNAVRESSNNYDPNEDIFGYYKFRDVLAADPAPFRRAVAPARDGSIAEVRRIAREVITFFKKLVEDNNLWELLWYERRPRHERAAQLLFYAVAEVFCKVNDVDVSPEVNAGGGPVDFKFSKGHSSRVVVELKMSSGRVVSGYEKQLEIYKKASATTAGEFVVVQIGPLGNKLREVRRMHDKLIESGKPASVVHLIDARRQPSASKA
jgi:hypothetical protein